MKQLIKDPEKSGEEKSREYETVKIRSKSQIHINEDCKSA